jgi:hypothetical protein
MGLVPISPNTTPSAPSSSAGRAGFPAAAGVDAAATTDVFIGGLLLSAAISHIDHNSVDYRIMLNLKQAAETSWLFLRGCYTAKG